MSSANVHRTVAVLGGGITGLVAAYRLNQLRPNWTVHLCEASPRLGGVIRTEPVHGYLVEHAADNFLRGPSAPWAEQFCQEIGFTDQLIPTNTQHRGAQIVWNNRLIPVPDGFQLLAPAKLWPLLFSPLLSWRGRLRICLEPFIREPSAGGEESLTQFATRRLGHEAFARLVQPLVSGIYTADPDRLSVSAALPQMVQMARQHGSLYRGMSKRRQQTDAATDSRGARYSLFVAPRGGMQTLIDAIQAALTGTTIHLNTRVTSVKRQGTGGWQLDYSEGAPSAAEKPTQVDGLIIALPAPRAAAVLQADQAQLSAELAGIPHASSIVVCLGVSLSDLAQPLTAFGCVVPAAAQRRILAISYSSLKFPDRAPEGQVLLRVFLGGALQPELAELADDAAIAIAVAEVRELLGLRGNPVFAKVVRWPRAMPQLELGHLQRVAQLEAWAQSLPDLQLAGNYLRGVGIPQCVESGQSAAVRLVDALSSSTHNVALDTPPQPGL